MFDLDNITTEHNEEHNLKWTYIPDYLHRMLIIRGSGSGKTRALLNQIKKKIATTSLTRFICMQKT